MAVQDPYWPSSLKYESNSIESGLLSQTTQHAWDHGIKLDQLSNSPKKKKHPIPFVKIKLTPA